MEKPLIGIYNSNLTILGIRFVEEPVVDGLVKYMIISEFQANTKLLVLSSEFAIASCLLLSQFPLHLEIRDSTFYMVEVLNNLVY